MPALAIPISADRAVARARAAMLLSTAVRTVIVVMAIVGMAMVVVLHDDSAGSVILLSAISFWLMLTLHTVRNQQGLRRVGLMIESRRFDDAEQTLAGALGSFSLYRAPVLQALQNLAALRHLQQRFDQTRILSAELLRHDPRPQSSRPIRLLLAEAALALDDLHTAHATLTQIGNSGSSLRETLKLTELQIDYCVRIGAWPQALENLPWKIELAELLPTESAAHVQALLALAAMKLHRLDWASWLRHRVELLVDPNPLIERRPILREVFVP